MKRGIFITFGILLIVLILGLWVYLLFFGTPQNANDIFADLGWGEREEIPRSTDTFTPIEPDTSIDIGSAALVQLTTRPVAGSVFLEGVDDTPVAVRYIERGVGHVYEIDLKTGLEERISGKTFTAVIEANFSPSGTSVALTTETDFGTATYVEELGENGSSHELPLGAQDVAFLSDSTVHYAISEEDRTVGYAYDLTERTTTELFSIPFTDATVIWRGSDAFVYNRPAPYLEGGLYQIGETGLSRIGETAYGLSAAVDPYNDRHLLVSANTRSNALVSVIRDGSGATSTLPVIALPEKCAFNPTILRSLWCAGPVDTPDRAFQTDWYKGLRTSSDLLWEIRPDAQQATVIIDFAAVTGRVIDAIRMHASMFGTHLMFINKHDGALWLYDLTYGTASEPEATIEQTKDATTE